MLQERALIDFKALATARVVHDNVRAHAAMMVSECYAIGFGSSNNSGEMLRWLHTAASLGLQKAKLWCPRVCQAVDGGLDDESGREGGIAEDFPSLGPQKQYLSTRILRFNADALRVVREGWGAIFSDAYPMAGAPPMYQVKLFNDEEVDDVPPLLLAAWLGDEETLLRLFGHANEATVSTLGFDVSHYASLGGHIGSLRLLAHRHICFTREAAHSITPLHLTIFLPPDQVKAAVDLLIEHGASADAVAQEIQWDAHDILLSGTVLDWAVTTRNRHLVACLVPNCSPSILFQGFQLAVLRSFWEIAEDLIPWSRDGPRILLSPATLRPFSHWIAHGHDFLKR